MSTFTQNNIFILEAKLAKINYYLPIYKERSKMAMIQIINILKKYNTFSDIIRNNQSHRDEILNMIANLARHTQFAEDLYQEQQTTLLRSEEMNRQINPNEDVKSSAFPPTGYFRIHDDEFPFQESYEVNLNPGHHWDTFPMPEKQKKRLKKRHDFILPTGETIPQEYYDYLFMTDQDKQEEQEIETRLQILYRVSSQNANQQQIEFAQQQLRLEKLRSPILISEQIRLASIDVKSANEQSLLQENFDQELEQEIDFTNIFSGMEE